VSIKDDVQTRSRGTIKTLDLHSCTNVVGGTTICAIHSITHLLRHTNYHPNPCNTPMYTHACLITDYSPNTCVNILDNRGTIVNTFIVLTKYFLNITKLILTHQTILDAEYTDISRNPLCNGRWTLINTNCRLTSTRVWSYAWEFLTVTTTQQFPRSEQTFTPSH